MAAYARATPPESISPYRLMSAVSVRPRTRPRVLVVEESDINRRLAQHVLAQAGLEADVVNNGHDAVRVFRQQRYDLVLLDCRLPGFPQFMAVRIMRLHERQAGRVFRVPVIGLTAFAPPGFVERCQGAGMDACLEKPLSSSKLQQILGRWLPAFRHPQAA